MRHTLQLLLTLTSSVKRRSNPDQALRPSLAGMGKPRGQGPRPDNFVHTSTRYPLQSKQHKPDNKKRTRRGDDSLGLGRWKDGLSLIMVYGSGLSIGSEPHRFACFAGEETDTNNRHTELEELS